MFQSRYDLVVAGGGVAGVAAALAGARRGLRTALVEKTVWFGGLATSGLIYIYLPLCDGNGTQVTFGISEEMLKRSLEYGPGEIPPGWRRERNAAEARRYRVIFSPASFVLSLDKMLEEAGVELWLDTVVTGATVEDGRLSAVSVANKSGCGELRAACFVDATGDADLAAFAGHGCIEAPNALANWTLEYREGAVGLAPNCSMAIVGCSTDPETVPPGISGRTVSEAVLAGRKRYRERLEREYVSGKFDRRSLFPLMLPAMAELRHTRCVTGEFTLEPGMEWTAFPDSVGLAADWRKPGFVWEIPYRTLLPKGLKGVLAAGRCSSSRGDAWEVTRVIPAAAMTGEAAGVAAALSVAAGITPDRLNCGVLSRELTQVCGFALHFGELGLSREERKP